jgi:hypothetical protein
MFCYLSLWVGFELKVKMFDGFRMVGVCLGELTRAFCCPQIPQIAQKKDQRDLRENLSVTRLSVLLSANLILLVLSK